MSQSNRGQLDGVKDTATGVRVGSAAVEFATDDSMVIAGGIGPRYADGQEGKLRAVATVIEGADGTRIAIVTCDILTIRRDYLDAATDRIEDELRIPAGNVLINATHTHHAPATVAVHGYDRIETFCAHVRDGVIEAVRRACGRLNDPDAGRCQMLFWLGEESSVGQNSRLLLQDGSIYWVGPRDDEVRPTGPFDPELPVIAFRREDGDYESIIFNHSTHCIGALSPGKRSPAFYGLAAQELENELGGRVTFISGAAASTHDLALDTKEMIHRIKFAVKDALRNAEPRQVTAVRSIKREITYEIRKFDEEKEAAAVVYYCNTRLSSDADFTIDVFRKTAANWHRTRVKNARPGCR